MIAEIISESYDVKGKRVFRPDERRRTGFRPTFPMGRFLSHPLKIHCRNFSEIRRFLLTCRYVSDEQQFGKDEFFQPPELFEETRKGDCEDFALWCWRQVLAMGYPSRFVVGCAGRYGEGHAWITFEKDGRSYILEPQLRGVSVWVPRLSTIRYQPLYSVAWDGERILYFAHEKRSFHPALDKIFVLVWEWLIFWALWWVLFPFRIVRGLLRRYTRRTY